MKPPGWMGVVFLAFLAAGALVGAGCDGQGDGPSPLDSQAVPGSTSTSAGFVWEGEPAPVGFLTDRYVPRFSFSSDGIEHRVLLSGVFLGIADAEVRTLNDGSTYTTGDVVFDFGEHPITGERVIGEFWLVYRYAVMRTVELNPDHLLPLWGEDWAGSGLVPLSALGIERDLGFPLEIGEVYPVELVVGIDPAWTCEDETFMSAAANALEWCDEGVAERLARGEPMWPSMHRNASLVAALLGEIDQPPPAGEPNRGGVLVGGPGLGVSAVYLPLGTLETVMTERGVPPSWTGSARYALDNDLPGFVGSDDLLVAWQRWQASGPDAYSYIVRVSKPGDDPAMGLVFVEGDRFVVVPTAGTYSGYRLVEYVGPVERLLALVESYASASLTVEYDPYDGHPTRIEWTGGSSSRQRWEVEILDLQPAEVSLGDGPSAWVDGAHFWFRFRRLLEDTDAVIEATVGTASAPVSKDGAGWIVELDNPSVLAARSRSEGDSFDEVVDAPFLGPRALRGLEGETLIIFLAESGWPSSPDGWEVVLAARHTPDGLEFVGSVGSVTDTNVNVLPTICDRDDPAPRDSVAELDLLLRWLDHFYATDDFEGAERAACGITEP